MRATAGADLMGVTLQQHAQYLSSGFRFLTCFIRGGTTYQAWLRHVIPASCPRSHRASDLETSPSPSQIMLDLAGPRFKGGDPLTEALKALLWKERSEFRNSNNTSASIFNALVFMCSLSVWWIT